MTHENSVRNKTLTYTSTLPMTITDPHAVEQFDWASIADVNEAESRLDTSIRGFSPGRGEPGVATHAVCCASSPFPCSISHLLSELGKFVALSHISNVPNERTEDTEPRVERRDAPWMRVPFPNIRESVLDRLGVAVPGSMMNLSCVNPAFCSAACTLTVAMIRSAPAETNS